MMAIAMSFGGGGFDFLHVFESHLTAANHLGTRKPSSNESSRGHEQPVH
jgi:hypothetical protein